MRYFIGNWKMFGEPKSIGILNKINKFVNSDKNNNKYKTVITPPFTLLENFSKLGPMGPSGGPVWRKP